MKKNFLQTVALICCILLCSLSCSVENESHLNTEKSTKDISVTAIKSREFLKNGDLNGIKTKVLKGRPLFFYSTILKKSKTLNLVVAFENNDGYVDGYIDYTMDSLGIIKNEAFYDFQSLKSRTTNSMDNQIAIFETLSSKGYKLNPTIIKELEVYSDVKKLFLNNSPSSNKINNGKANVLSSSSHKSNAANVKMLSVGRQCGAYFRGHYILDYKVDNTCPATEYHNIVARLDTHIENQIREYLNQNGNYSFSINYGVNGFYINGGELGGLTDYSQTDNLLQQWFSSFPLSMSCIREFRYVNLTGFGATCADPNNPGGDGTGTGSAPPLVGDEGTGESPDAPDPDLPSNCDSWKYTPVSSGDYQVSGVTNLRFDYISEYMGTDGKMHIDYYRGTFNRPLYFEFPRIRANGDFLSPEAAARLTAEIKDRAEEILESQVNASPTPQTTIQSDQMIERFYNILKAQMEQYGGRVTKVNNYGNGIIIKPYSKTILPCY